MSEIDKLQLERTPQRIRKFLRRPGPMPALGLESAGRVGGSENSGRGSARPTTGGKEGELRRGGGLADEGVGSYGGLGEGDVLAISKRLMAARAEEGRAISTAEAEGIARNIVHTADRALLKLDEAGEGALNQSDAFALEAVVHVRGRPAVRVLSQGFESFDLYPDATMWKLLADEHFTNLWNATAATAAVRVTDRLLTDRQWVQGTAFLVGPNLMLTNRHVLFPSEGVRLARRFPGSSKARMKGEYDVLLDFTFDNGGTQQVACRIIEIPFVADDSDPVDAALLRVEPINGGLPKPLTLSRENVFDIDRLYIVGHPGYLDSVPDDILAVFGRPDERKRVSFGELMDPVSAEQTHIVHDASTISGFSGAPVIGFESTDVRALHYWGDAKAGNRAVPSDAIRKHPLLGNMV